MAIGDVWRVAVRGATGPEFQAPLGNHTDWVNVFHCQTFDGAGPEDDEAFELQLAFLLMFFDLGSSGVFGVGTSVQSIEVINQSNDHAFETQFEVDIGLVEGRPLPSQVSIALTGRNDAVGRRVTMYVASINEFNLLEFGRLDGLGAVGILDQWFNTKFSGVWAWDCVIFDRAKILPTIIIDRWRMSPNFRTQRRRVLTTSQPLVTVYGPLPG